MNTLLNMAIAIGVMIIAVICFMSNEEIDEATYIYRQMANQQEE